MAFDSPLYPVVAQVVTYSTNSTNVPADFNALTQAIELYATTACFVKLHIGTGMATAAAGTDLYIEAGGKRLYATRSHKRVSVVRSTADGILYITELNDPQAPRRV